MEKREVKDDPLEDSKMQIDGICEGKSGTIPKDATVFEPTP
jgi:hypothetical protein